MTEHLEAAEQYLVSALEALDAVSAPADIGAYVDMALHRLKDFRKDSIESGVSRQASEWPRNPGPE